MALSLPALLTRPTATCLAAGVVVNFNEERWSRTPAVDINGDRRAPVAPVSERETTRAQRLKAVRKRSRAAFVLANDWLVAAFVRPNL